MEATTTQKRPCIKYQSLWPHANLKLYIETNTKPEVLLNEGWYYMKALNPEQKNR